MPNESLKQPSPYKDVPTIATGGSDNPTSLKTWRPKDWPNPYRRYEDSSDEGIYKAFEQGADAMLEALEKTYGLEFGRNENGDFFHEFTY